MGSVGGSCRREDCWTDDSSSVFYRGQMGKNGPFLGPHVKASWLFHMYWTLEGNVTGACSTYSYPTYEKDNGTQPTPGAERRGPKPDCNLISILVPEEGKNVGRFRDGEHSAETSSRAPPSKRPTNHKYSRRRPRPLLHQGRTLPRPVQSFPVASSRHYLGPIHPS